MAPLRPSQLPRDHGDPARRGASPLRGGRTGRARRAGGEPVLRRAVWPGESPLGKRIYNTGPIGAWTVVGVVGDVRHKTLGAPAEPTMYRTTAQASSRRLHLVARVVGDPAAAIPETQQAIRALDPDTPLTDAGTMSTLMRESEADDRFRAILMRTFAALAALLASFEVFGVTARAVSARAERSGSAQRSGPAQTD